MNAVDTRDGFEEKDRLTMAKHMITAFVTDNPQHRYSLVIFAGEAFVSTPLTLDEQAFLTFLEGVDSNDVGVQGTNLPEALQASIERFRTQDEEERGKAIVIISDGGDEETGQYERFGTIAKQENIAVFTVGVGGFDGVPIPEGADAFGRVEYKTYQGQTVLTELNEAPLKQVADDAGGQYLHGRSVNALSQIEANIAALQSSTLSEETGTRLEERYQIFVLLAGICFLAGVLLPVDEGIFRLPYRLYTELKRKVALLHTK
jgi:Ca-activated chloride channel family protein